MVPMIKSRLKKCCLFIMVLLVAALPFMIGVPAALPGETNSTGTKSDAKDGGAEKTGQTTKKSEEVTGKPLTVIMGGAKTTSDVPVINIGSQIYVPVRFMAESLGLPVDWDSENKTVYIGVRPAGTDMVEELPPFRGRKIEQPVKISAIGYPKGYILDPSPYTEVCWKLDERYRTVKINLGVPDNMKDDTAEFEVKADGSAIATEKLSKDDGLKEFNYNVSGVKEFTVSCLSGEGIALICPIAQ